MSQGTHEINMYESELWEGEPLSQTPLSTHTEDTCFTNVISITTFRKLCHGSCLPMAALSAWKCLPMAALSAWSCLPIAVLSSMYAREGLLASSARTKHALAPGH